MIRMYTASEEEARMGAMQGVISRTLQAFSATPDYKRLLLRIAGAHSYLMRVPATVTAACQTDHIQIAMALGRCLQAALKSPDLYAMWRAQAQEYGVGEAADKIKQYVDQRREKEPPFADLLKAARQYFDSTQSAVI